MLRLTAFGLACLPFVLLVAWFYNNLYGSPFQSGYGSTDSIFSSANLRANLARYPRWLWDTQGPLVFLFVLSPLLPPGPNPDSRWLRRILFAFAGGVLACYLWYLPFDAWWFLRFLLPAFPVLFVLAADVVWHGSRRFGVRTQIAAAIAFTRHHGELRRDTGVGARRARDRRGRTEVRRRRTLPRCEAPGRTPS